MVKILDCLKNVAVVTCHRKIETALGSREFLVQNCVFFQMRSLRLEICIYTRTRQNSEQNYNPKDEANFGRLQKLLSTPT